MDLILVNFCPLCMRDCLVCNNSNDAFIQTRKIFLHTQGKYFADEQLLFGRCNSKVFLMKRDVSLGKKFVNLTS